jgi:hypothetical protein
MKKTAKKKFYKKLPIMTITVKDLTGPSHKINVFRKDITLGEIAWVISHRTDYDIAQIMLIYSNSNAHPRRSIDFGKTLTDCHLVNGSEISLFYLKDQKIAFYLYTYSCKVYSVTMSRFETIVRLKEKAQDLMGIPLEYIIFASKEFELKDESCFYDLGFTEMISLDTFDMTKQEEVDLFEKSYVNCKKKQLLYDN